MTTSSLVCRLALTLAFTCTLGAASGYSPDIAFAFSQDAVAIDPAIPHPGIVEVTVTITDHVGQHAQYYTNMRPQPTVEDGTADGSVMIDSSPFVRTLRIDGRDLYDGAQLVSVHVHPHGHGHPPYISDFTVGAASLRTANGHPAPSGDTELPDLTGLPAALTTSRDTTGRGTQTDFFDPVLSDDVSSGQVARSSRSDNGIQIIAHLGTSVLGRFRWSGQNPPFGDESLVDNVSLFTHQTANETTGRIVLFCTDAAGRANYAFLPITLPAIDSNDQALIDTGIPDARIVGIEQGDHLVVPEAGLPVQIEVHNPSQLLQHGRYSRLTLWVGNRAVANANLWDWATRLPADGHSFLVELTIPYDQIRVIEQARDPGMDAQAMALWCDFANSRPSFPTSEHIHLASIRTTTLGYPYGQAFVDIYSPEDGTTQVGPDRSLTYTVGGSHHLVASAAIAVDGTIVETGIPRNGEWTLPLSRGLREVSVLALDSDGAVLASDAVSVTVVNEPPQGFGDSYAVAPEQTFQVDAAAGVLANDRDAEDDPLGASLSLAPNHGQLDLNAEGGFTYTPDAGFSGVDQFTYRVSDPFDSGTEQVVYLVVADRGESAGEDDWPTLGSAPDHNAGTSHHLLGRSWTRTWSRDHALEVNPPVAASGLLYLSTTDGFSVTGSLYCLDLSDGAEVWRHDFAEAKALGDPTVAGDRVYLQRSNHSSDSQLWAMDRFQGTVSWSAPYSTQWKDPGAPLVAGGAVFANGGYYGGLYAWNDDGSATQRWWIDLENYDRWSPAWSEGRLFSWLGEFFREHDPATGQVMSQVAGTWDWAGWDMQTTPVIAGQDAILTGNAGIFAIDLATFTARWHVPGTYQQHQGLSAVADGRVYTLDGTTVMARTLTDGSLLWQIDPNLGELRQQPIPGADGLIVSGASGCAILDPATGAIDTLLPDGGIPIVCDGGLVLVEAGRVVRYKLEPVPNAAPTAVATANPDSVTVGSAVALSGSGSADTDGSIASYAWSQTAGPSVSLSGADSVSAGFTPSEAGSYGFSLTVTDDDGASASDSVTVTVEHPVIAQQPFGGSIPVIAASGPTRIQAEDYDLGGADVAFHDTTSGNSGGAYRNDAVDLQSTSDSGGGYNVGWIAAGEWLEYSVDVAQAGSYAVDLRVARSPSGSGALHLEVDRVDLSGSVVVPSTGGWQTWTTVSTTVDLAAGEQVLRLALDGSSFNVNWLEFSLQEDPPVIDNAAPTAVATASPDSVTAGSAVTLSGGGSWDSDGSIASYAWTQTTGPGVILSGADSVSADFTPNEAGSYGFTLTVTDDDGASASDSVTVTVESPVISQQPFGGSIPVIAASGPTRIQAEDYDLGGADVAFHDTTGDNSGGAYRNDAVDLQPTSDSGGGYNVGWIAAGEWLEYSVDVAQAGTYTLDIRVARSPSGSGALHLEVDGVNLSGSVAVPSTGGWQTWTTVSTIVDLVAGEQVLRLALDGSSFNVNWLEFSLHEAPSGIGLVPAAINAGGGAFTTADGTFYRRRPGERGHELQHHRCDRRHRG